MLNHPNIFLNKISLVKRGSSICNSIIRRGPGFGCRSVRLRCWLKWHLCICRTRTICSRPVAGHSGQFAGSWLNSRGCSGSGPIACSSCTPRRLGLTRNRSFLSATELVGISRRMLLADLN